MLLSEIIKKKIKEEGPISFRDFMEMALYYPEVGYYLSAPDKIGTGGDYYTSSNVTPGFGAMIARQLEEMWHHLGKKEFTIVEYGAGTGTLSHDILTCLKGNPPLFEALNYCIIEKSPVMREKEKRHLHEKVRWHDSIQNIPGIVGCIFSNEVVDNFSVYQVVMDDELMEVFVDYENDFVEVLRPASPALKDYLGELQISLPRGFRTEINLDAITWIKEIAAALKRGYVITIDYGFSSSELYDERRRNGTLTCYHKHKLTESPYRHIGEQDITAHVNFSALQHWGLKNGLDYCGFTDQAHFLLALGFDEYLLNSATQEQDMIAYYRKRMQLIQTLLMDMGTKFKVLIQQKGIPQYNLWGLRL